jgi:hypothetical protein
MKLICRQGKQGNTLMIVLFFSLAIGMVLASILHLVSSRYTNTVRSTEWNAAIPVLEAGIEEAMTHLHDDATPGANGWTAATVGGSLVYQKQRTFTDGSYFYATIYNAGTNNPIIISQGYVRSPLSSSQYITRMVRVCATNPPNIFTKAVAAAGQLTFNGGGLVDGFDSRIGGYSTLTNRNATGDVATDSTATPAMTLGNCDVYGKVTTGPGGNVSIGGGNVGSVAWNATNNGIQPGWTNDNMNVSFPSNPPPSGSFSFFPTASNGVTYVPDGTFSTTSFSSTGNPMIVTGNATLWVSGDFTLKGTGYVQIMPGASLTLYIGGNADIGGGGVINSSAASHFSLIGLSGCTSVKYAGGAQFVGTINAPQASFTFGGTSDFFGAAIVQSATFNGGVNFHYDDALAAQNGLVATSWTEL